VGTAGGLAERTELPARSPTREEISRYDEAVQHSREEFGRVEIDSDYNLGCVVDMGRDSAVDIDDEGFRFEDTNLAETGYWKYCDMKDDC
jgi:hypothetical protein